MQAATAPTARRLLVVLAATVVALLVFVPGAGAAQVSFKAKRVSGHSAVFRVRGVDAGSVRRAKLSVGRYRKRIRTSQMRRAARRGSLRVRLPRRIAKRLRGRAHASARRRRPKLTVVLDNPIVRPTGPVHGPVINFETGDFSEAANFSTEAGSLNVMSGRGYEGTHSARASYSGGGVAGFQRVWQNVNWANGTDVWYGMALYIPNTSDYRYWNPLRWDNYRSYQGDGDTGGLTIEQGSIHLVRSNYNREEHVLIDGGKAPQGRWFWVELHQRFSGTDGQALSELYLDGRKLGSSTNANSAGRGIDNLRAGVVNVAGSCSKASSVDFDRFSISDGMRGPKA